MSFDVKYDRDGLPIIKAPSVAQAPAMEAQETMETVAQEPEIEQAAQQDGLAVLAEETEQVAQPDVNEVVEEKQSVDKTTPRLDKRLKVLMDKAQRMEKERNEAMLRLEQVEREKSRWRSETQIAQAEQDEDFNLAPDDIAEGKHLSKVQQKLKKMEQALAMQQQQSASAIAQAKLNARYPDFSKVVSAENVAVLQELHPEIYQTLSSNNDLYSTGTSAYTIIKNLGIHTEDTFEQDRARVQKNVAKPKSLATISPQRSESPLSQANAFANGLTPDLQKQLIKEMQDSRRNI